MTMQSIVRPSPPASGRPYATSRWLWAAALVSIVVGLLLTATLGRIVVASPTPRPSPPQALVPAPAPGDTSVPDAARALAGRSELLQEPAPTF
ncbi:MAG: hypothetical protein AMXMBFR66_06400 [Pseudomonadota bacterium]|nr:hypothetical protein [Rubrivivax sp.]NLZ42244.1 hypothetical protein [Comamonadaceae bacterium]